MTPNQPPSREIIDYIRALDNQQELRDDPYLSEGNIVKDVAAVYLRKRDIIRILLWQLGLTNKLYTR